MRKKYLGFATIGLALALCLAKLPAAEKSSIGVVDFAKCIHTSKIGKKEQENFEAVRNQMQKAIEDLESQLNETAKQLQNPDLLDSLNPEAEKELKTKFQALNEELNRYQSQYYQVMQQANMKVVHTVADEINKASELIAKKEKFALVINKEAAFHYMSSLDITDAVIAEMDRKFDKEPKQPVVQATPGTQAATATQGVQATQTAPVKNDKKG